MGFPLHLGFLFASCMWDLVLETAEIQKTRENKNSHEHLPSIVKRLGEAKPNKPGNF